ncbi:MAG: DNA-3-methyladenine glycosylase I [candidate division WOR-3 bacterium]
MNNDIRQAVSIFEKVESTLIRNHPDFTERSRRQAVVDFKRMLREFQTDTDDDFFFHMTMIVFYSGFRASTVNKKKPVIYRYFKSYKKVATYSRKDVTRILNDPKMIAHRNKIKSMIDNAKQFVKLVGRFGSFRNYLLSFNPKFPLSEDNLDQLRADLMKRFAYLGPATVNHFLTDYGFPVVKPDRMIMRVLHRSHLIPSESVRHYPKAIAICKGISETLAIPIRYVDSVFVCLGQVGEANICSKNNPKCDKCDLKNVCNFYD